MPRDYDEELQGWLIDNQEGLSREDTAEWEPQNDADAEFALLNLRRAHEELRRIEAAAEREMERIKAFQDQASVGPLEAVTVWENRLIGYYKRLERDQPGTKATYALPSGTIRRTAGRERVVIEDEKEFCEWALVTHPDLIKMSPVKDSIKQKATLQPITNKKALKDTAKRSPTGARSQLIDTGTGEKVPGVQIEIGPTTYSAKPS